MTSNILKNTNVSALIGFKNDNDILSNITINNTIKIPFSSETTLISQNNANACVYMKDINSNGSGNFYAIKVNSLENSVPYLYFNSNLVIDSSNFLSELENILTHYTLDTSNLVISGGYINFYNGSNPNQIQGANGVGLRYSANNTVQFKNYDTNWIDLVDITRHDQFSELIDVNVSSNLLNKQYITYNSSSNMFINSNLSISDDRNPTLSGNLVASNNSITFSSNINNIIYNNVSLSVSVTNPYISLKNNTSITGKCNYLTINNAGTDVDPSIICTGSDANISLDITTKGNGNINLNASLGNIYTNSDSLHISGYVKNSIYRTSTKVGGYIPETTWNIPINTDTFLFDFTTSSMAGTYWANVSAGIEGQKINFIFNNKSSNSISVLANFGSNGIIIGSGYNNGLGLIFETTGQSTSLIYLDDGIDAWQVLNTGASVF